MKPSLVLFDLDHTLLNGDTQSEWGRYLADRNIIDLVAYQTKMAHFDQGYRQGKLDVEGLLQFQVEILKPYSLEKLHAWREEFVKERIRPLIVEEGWKAIAHHQKQGDQIILITATNEFLTKPIAQLLGIEHLIALKEERDQQGKYTGRVVGVPSYREGKIRRLEEWLIEQGRSFEDYTGTWLYSDSHNDLPLFLIVNNPVVVNPDKKLLDYAQEKKWPIVDFGVRRVSS